MALLLYAHPFSSYCQKALIALYEHAVPFEWRLLAPEHPEALAAHAALWPLQRMPVLVDDGRAVLESSVIVEYVDRRHRRPDGGVALLPDDADAALDVRFMDRFFDGYVMTPMQKLVFDCLRAPQQRDPHGVAEARQLLERAYQWLDQRMAQRTWAAAGAFSLADCAAAPALFFADWVHPIGAAWPHARAYRQRLLARPSFARAVDEARPYRRFFPPGAPERD